MLHIDDVLPVLRNTRKVGHDEYLGSCPTHDDKNPSLSVSAGPGGKALYHCYAGCSQQDVTDELYRLIGRTDRATPEKAANKPPAPTPEFSFSLDKLARLEAQLREQRADPLSPLSTFFAESGLSDAVVQRLRFGYAPGPRALVIPQFWEGDLVGVKFRALAADIGPNEKWTQVPGSKSDFLYQADAAPVDPDCRVVAVFEGIRDTALALSLGFNAVGMTSAGSLSPTERFVASVERIKANYDYIVLVGDMDDVGQEAIHTLAEQIGRRGCLFTKLPQPHKDLSDFYIAEGEQKVREWLTWAYDIAGEATPIPRGTPRELFQGVLTRALVQLDDGADVEAVRSGLRTELRKVEEDVGFPAPLGAPALQGVFGDIVREALPHSEADENCLLYQTVAALGNLAGRKNYTTYGADHHYPNLFVNIVGRTNAGKGQGLGMVRYLAQHIDAEWANKRCRYSAASGEAIVRLADESEKAEDGRLCLILPELAVLLNSMNREGSNTSGYLRIGYDGLPLENQRSRQSVSATNYLLSVISHVTPDELRECLAAIDWANGIANRFLFAAVRPYQILARSAGLPDFSASETTIKKLLSLPAVGRVNFSDAGGASWDVWVRGLPELEGKLELSQARVRANALRVALIYASFDPRRLDDVTFETDKNGEPRPVLALEQAPPFAIEEHHVEAAIEVVTRSRATVEWYLSRASDTGGVSPADVARVRLEANKAGGRLSGTELYRLFSHRTLEQRVEIASRAGLKRRSVSSSDRGGKPQEVWSF